MTRRRSALSVDAGATLIEVLMAVALSVVLMAVLVTAMVVGLRGSRATAETLQDSSDAQLIASYLTQDVQSVAGSGDVVIGSHTSDCSGTAGDGVLRLRWTEDDGTATTYSVSYFVRESTDASVTGNARRWRMTRYACTTAAATPKTQVVARNLADPSDASTKPSLSTSAARLTATFTDVQTDGQLYRFTLAAAFRAAVSGAAALPPVPPAPAPDPSVIGVPVGLDTDFDGKLDTVQVDFDSPVSPACSGGWTVSGLPPGFTAATSATLSATRTRATIALTASATAYSTATTGMTAKLSPAAGCSVANGNLPQAVLDRARPVAYAVTTTVSGTTAGRMQTGDVIEVAFSEKVIGLPNGVSSITLVNGQGSAPDTINVAGLSRGAISTGGTGGNRYTASNKTVTAAAAIVSTDERAVVTVGTIANAADLATGQGAVAFVAASSVKDLADVPNEAASTPVPSPMSVRLF